VGGIISCNLAPAVFWLTVREHPDVSGDAGVVEQVQREGDDGLQPIALNDPSADVALPCPASPVKGGAIVHLCDAAAERVSWLHLAQLLARKSIWPSLERV